jgi:hypothetical protein
MFKKAASLGFVFHRPFATMLSLQYIKFFIVDNIPREYILNQKTALIFWVRKFQH